MAYITNADGSINYIFGQGNIERYSQERELPILATLPLIPAIVENLGKLFEKLTSNI